MSQILLHRLVISGSWAGLENRDWHIQCQVSFALGFVSFCSKNAIHTQDLSNSLILQKRKSCIEHFPGFPKNWIYHSKHGLDVEVYVYFENFPVAPIIQTSVLLTLPLWFSSVGNQVVVIWSRVLRFYSNTKSKHGLSFQRDLGSAPESHNIVISYSYKPALVSQLYWVDCLMLSGTRHLFQHWRRKNISTPLSSAGNSASKPQTTGLLYLQIPDKLSETINGIVSCSTNV